MDMSGLHRGRSFNCVKSLSFVVSQYILSVTSASLLYNDNFKKYTACTLPGGSIVNTGATVFAGASDLSSFSPMIFPFTLYSCALTNNPLWEISDAFSNSTLLLSGL